MTLAETSKGRDNNLNVIRLVAAVMVIFSHSWPLSYGADHSDILDTFSHGQITFGNVAVCIFFFLGGFLIMGSAERSRTAKVFFQKRIQRLFPSLTAVILITVLILGPLLTNISLVSYFTNLDTYKYLLNIILLPVHSLPGVFTTTAYGTTINGPLWTLPLEFCCYVFCFVMFCLHVTDRRFMKYSILLFIPAYITMFYLFASNGPMTTALRVAGMFYVGMLYYVYRDKIVMDARIFWGLLILFLVSLPLNILEYTILFSFPYMTAYVGFAKKKFHFLDGKPDISYQVYLVACPIQQIICQMFGGTMNSFINFLIAAPVSIAAGWLIYEMVEKNIVLKIRAAKA